MGQVVSRVYPETRTQEITLSIRTTVFPNVGSGSEAIHVDTSETVTLPFTERPATDVEFLAFMRTLGKRVAMLHNIKMRLEGLPTFHVLRIENLLIDLTEDHG